MYVPVKIKAESNNLLLPFLHLGLIRRVFIHRVLRSCSYSSLYSCLFDVFLHNISTSVFLSTCSNHLRLTSLTFSVVFATPAPALISSVLICVSVSSLSICRFRDSLSDTSSSSLVLSHFYVGSIFDRSHDRHILVAQPLARQSLLSNRARCCPSTSASVFLSFSSQAHPSFIYPCILLIACPYHFKAKMYEIFSDTHKLQFLKLHHLKLGTI